MDGTDLAKKNDVLFNRLGDIIETYINTNPITQDDGVVNSTDLHLYERGPEDIKHLFYTEDYDVLFIYGEPRTRSIRQIQDVPVHFLMRYPVTVVTINKYDPILGTLICTSSTMQAKARTALRAAIAASAQSAAGATPAYNLTVMEEQGRNQWQAGLNIIETPYVVEWTTGGP